MTSCWCRNIAGAAFAIVLALFYGPLGLSKSSLEVASMTVEVSVDKHAVQVAEPVAVQIVVRAAAGTVINFPQIQDRWGDWEVLSLRDQSDIPAASGASIRIWTRRLLLESLASGAVALPEMPIEAVLQSGDRETLRTESQIIRVESQLREWDSPKRFRDIQGVVQADTHTKRTWAWLFWLAIAWGGIVLLGYAAAKIFRQRRLLSPAQWALLELEGLKKKSAQLSEQGAECKGNYQKIGDVLRTYLQARLGIAPGQLTEQEFFHGLQTTCPSKPARLEIGETRSGLYARELQSLLSQIEKARFSLAIPSDPEIQKISQQTMDWIQGLEAVLDSRQSVEVAAKESA